MWSRPVYLALYLLGTEVFAVKLGPDTADPPARPIEGGGATGSHAVGFTMGPDPVVVVDEALHQLRRIKRDGDSPC